MIAEMRRTRGDPILFLKGDGEGREVLVSVLQEAVLYQNIDDP